MVEIIIPRPPSVNRLWRMGNGRMYRSAEYVQWLNACVALVKSAKYPAILGKYKLMIRVARPDKRRRDIDNLIKAASDFLQHAGIVQDDCLCEAVHCKWVESGPEVVINVYPVGRYHELSRGIKEPLQSGPEEIAPERNRKRSPREELAAAYAAVRNKGKAKVRPKAGTDFGKG